MKTTQFKSGNSKPQPTKQKVVRVQREPPIWLQIVIGDLKDLLLITKDKLPLPNKPKVESWEDWEETFRR
jgi:hypothetical protein